MDVTRCVQLNSLFNIYKMMQWGKKTLVANIKVCALKIGELMLMIYILQKTKL